MTDFTIHPRDIKSFGTGLSRPECVACTASGTLWVSHALPHWEL